MGKKRLCACGGSRFEIYIAVRPENNKLGYLTVCKRRGCGKAKWMLKTWD